MPVGQAPVAPQQMPQGRQNQKSDPRELEIRARNEMAMLEQTAKKKQMLSQMKPKIDAKAVRRASGILVMADSLRVR